MSTTHARRSRGIALALPALPLAALALALPAAARADPQFCFGSTTRMARTAERDSGVTYAFKCSQPIKAFAVTTTTKIAAFDVSADVLDPPELGGGLRGDDRFGECEGDIPSYGFTCTGTYQGFSRKITASYDLLNDPCARDRHGHLRNRTLVTVENANGRLAGPYGLGKPKGCAAAAKRR